MKLMIACGGVHSKNDPQIITVNDEKIILDIDVRSYYPSLILLYGIGPEIWKRCVLKVYSRIKSLRVKAKLEKNKSLDNGLKLILNSTYPCIS